MVMSRKVNQKSNMLHIGIFEEKKPGYNKLILETLLTEGDLNTWGIARHICQIRNPNVIPEILYYRSQKIYAVIQRKKGRVEDLQSKGYITYTLDKDNGKWSLTFKGRMAILCLRPELNKMVHPSYDMSIRFSRLFKTMGPIPNKISMPFGGEIDGSVVKTFLSWLKPEFTKSNLSSLLVEATKNLVAEGIDLDRIKNEKFIMLLASEHARLSKLRLP